MYNQNTSMNGHIEGGNLRRQGISWKRNTNLQSGEPSIRILLSDLKLCSKTRDLERGKQVHANAIKCGYDSNVYVLNTLINMYVKCDSMVDAWQVFNGMQKPTVVSWSVLLSGYAENGEGHMALELFSKMKNAGYVPDSIVYVAVIKACTSLAVRDCSRKEDYLQLGRKIHSEIGRHLDHYVQNTLIDMYSKCGSIRDARYLFNTMQKPNVVSWSAMMSGYVENGEGNDALDLFSRMKIAGCTPDSVTYVAAVKACASLAASTDGSEKIHVLEQGREVHKEIGHHLDHYVQTALIDMYAKCGSMVDALQVFEGMQKPNVIAWSALIMGYAENEEGLAALDMFSSMKTRGCKPDYVAYVAAIKACTSLAVSEDQHNKKECLERGRKIHSEVGCHLNRTVQNTLIDMYSKCGCSVLAKCVFDNIEIPDVVSWNSLLLGYVDNGEGNVAVDLLSRMKAAGCAPDAITYIGALRACGLVGALVLGRKLHSQIVEFTSVLVTCLVDFYTKCGSMIEARSVFDTHAGARQVSTWTVLLSGYGRFGDSDTVIKLFEIMKDDGFRPDAVTFLSMLLCCSHAGLVDKARGYLEEMRCLGAVPSVMHYACMVDVLGRANQLTEAISLLKTMPCNPNTVTWKTLLSACCKWKNVELGRMAFQSLLALTEEDASAHVLMARIYGRMGMFEEQDRVLQRNNFK